MTIKNVSKQKLLGVYIDENLTWSSHIDHLCSIVSSKISLLRQLATYVPTNVQKLYYQGYILPYIDYGSVVWGADSSTNIKRLTKLQKRAAWIILHADYDTSSDQMFKELRWLSVPDRLKYNKAVLTYRAVNNLSPEYISKLLKPMSEVHNLNLQSSVNGTLYHEHHCMMALSLVQRQGYGTLFLKQSQMLLRFQLLSSLLNKYFNHCYLC